jgi:hypothetical protein
MVLGVRSADVIKVEPLTGDLIARSGWSRRHEAILLAHQSRQAVDCR